MNHYEERAIQTSILLSFGVCSHNTGTIWKQHKIVTDRPLVSTKTTQCLPVHVENGRIWKRNPNSRHNLKTASCEPSRGLKRNIFHPTFFNTLQTRGWLTLSTHMNFSVVKIQSLITELAVTLAPSNYLSFFKSCRYHVITS